jgi:hypothetical protein
LLIAVHAKNCITVTAALVFKKLAEAASIARIQPLHMFEHLQNSSPLIY